MTDAALVVIGLQRDYFSGGRFELPGIERTVVNASALLLVCRSFGIPVVHVRHVEKDPAVGFLMEGSAGAEIDPRVAPSGNDLLITKNWPNAFRDTKFQAILDILRPQELVFCGAMSNLCVDATVKAAFDLDYKCTIVEDACAASDLEFNGTHIPAAQVHAVFMAALASAYGAITDLKAFNDRLTRS